MATSSERALFDTNILVYAMNEDAEHHVPCRVLRDRAETRDIDVCLTSQVLFEYFAVVTNPRMLATPLSSREALGDIEKLATVFPLIEPPADLHERVFTLIREKEFSGRRVFDLVLAATMLSNGVSQIYTYDEGFEKIPGLTRLTAKQHPSSPST